tara:strand:- start:47 stop:643 length:597 start_codon:yes stop_codon:yes gene_type:complete
VRINLGSGSDKREGYVNIDAFAEQADIRSDLCTLGIQAGSASEVYCSHVLEHLSEHQVLNALGEMRRVLSPDGGRAEILVPDFQWCVENWLNLPESQRWGWAIDTIFGNQNHEGEYHRTGFTVGRMRALLQKSGFTDIDVGTVFSHGMQSVKAIAMARAVSTGSPIEIPKRATNKIVMAKFRLRAFWDALRILWKGNG